MKTTTKRISSLLASALMLFGALGSVSCDDKDKPEPVYKTPEGLLLTTSEAANGTILYDFYLNSSFIFYSEVFPIPTLGKTILTICPLSDKHLSLVNYMPANGETNYNPTESIPFPIIFYPPSDYMDHINLPECNKGNIKNLAIIYYYLPEDGTYDFYFRIENPSENIFYETPHYRYTIRTEDKRRYTSISIIN